MNIEVVYYYKKTSGGVLTKYIDQVTKKEIAIAYLKYIWAAIKKNYLFIKNFQGQKI